MNTVGTHICIDLFFKLKCSSGGIWGSRACAKHQRIKVRRPSAINIQREEPWLKWNICDGSLPSDATHPRNGTYRCERQCGSEITICVTKHHPSDLRRRLADRHASRAQSQLRSLNHIQWVNADSRANWAVKFTFHFGTKLLRIAESLSVTRMHCHTHKV